MHRTTTRTVLLAVAKSKGFFHEKGKYAGTINQNAVADSLKVHQPTLKRFLDRKVDTAPWLVDAMVIHWGMTRDQAEGRQNSQLSLPVSPTAAFVSENWDKLPPDLQGVIFDIMDRWLAFERRQPLLAKTISAQPTGEEYKLWEKRIELWQAQYRKKAQPT